MTKVTKSVLFLLLKVGLIATAYGYIAWQLSSMRDLHHVLNELGDRLVSSEAVFTFLIVLLLMVLNWGVEAQKWLLLMIPFKTIRFSQSYGAVLAGLTVSVFTPNRIGEFFGRVLSLSFKNPVFAMLSTLAGSFAQLMVTIVFGLPAALYIYLLHLPDGQMPVDSILLAVSFIPLLLLILLFQYLPSAFRWVMSLTPRKLRVVKYYGRAFTLHTKTHLNIVLFLSFLRYTIFAAQYVILLRFFGVGESYCNLFIPVAAVFFIMMAIPSVALAELGVRSSVALSVFSVWYGLSQQLADDVTLGIMVSASVLWIINIAIPALVGSFYVGHFNFTDFFAKILQRWKA